MCSCCHWLSCIAAVTPVMHCCYHATPVVHCCCHWLLLEATELTRLQLQAGFLHLLQRSSWQLTGIHVAACPSETISSQTSCCNDYNMIAMAACINICMPLLWLQGSRPCTAKLPNGEHETSLNTSHRQANGDRCSRRCFACMLFQCSMAGLLCALLQHTCSLCRQCP